MQHLLGFLNILLPALYGLTVYLYGKVFFRGTPSAGSNRGMVLKSTVFLHIVALALRGGYFGYFPSSDLYEMASVVALAISLIYLYIEWRNRQQSTGFFVLIVPLLLQLFSSLFIGFEHEFPEILRSPMFVAHTVTAILGYSALFLSALYGLMYLMLFYDLKSAQFGVIYRRMSSLEELSEMNIRAAVAGFLLLTVTIFLGIMWRNHAYPEAHHFDPEVIAAYVVWSIYAAVIYGKKIGGWAGKWLAYVSLAGFVVIIISIVIVRAVATSFHQFG